MIDDAKEKDDEDAGDKDKDKKKYTDMTFGEVKETYANSRSHDMDIDEYEPSAKRDDIEDAGIMNKKEDGEKGPSTDRGEEILLLSDDNKSVIDDAKEKDSLVSTLDFDASRLITTDYLCNSSFNGYAIAKEDEEDYLCDDERSTETLKKCKEETRANKEDMCVATATTSTSTTTIFIKSSIENGGNALHHFEDAGMNYGEEQTGKTPGKGAIAKEDEEDYLCDDERSTETLKKCKEETRANKEDMMCVATATTSTSTSTTAFNMFMNRNVKKKCYRSFIFGRFPIFLLVTFILSTHCWSCDAFTMKKKSHDEGISKLEAESFQSFQRSVSILFKLFVFLFFVTIFFTKFFI